MKLPTQALRWIRALACVCLGYVAPALQAAPTERSLTVAAYPAVDAMVRAAIPAWKRLHPDVEIRLVSRQFNDHHTAMTTVVSTSSRGPDLMALEVGFVGRFAQGGGLQNLSGTPYSAAALRSSLVSYASNQALNPRGDMVAVPLDIGPATLLYRDDLIRRAGLTEADLTQSWDSYVQSGVQIRERTGAYLVAHARDLKDIIIRTTVPPGDGLYFDRESRPIVNSPRFVRAFELALSVRRKGLDARVSAWSNEWTEGFRRGTLATQFSGAWLVGHLSNWLAPATTGLWRASQLPEGSWAAFGGTFLAIPRNAPESNKALAWEFIRLMTLERDMQLSAFRAHDAFPALIAVHDDPFLNEPLPFLGGQRARLQWRDAARQIRAVRVHKQDAFADELINSELDKVLSRGKPIPAALADAQRMLERRANR